jgi:WD40 repeat protein
VAKEGVRPERPDEEYACHLTDDIWELAENCWVADPNQRPTANVVSNKLSNLLDATAFSEPTPDPCRPLTPTSTLSSLTLQGHTSIVYCATFSPDGKFVISCSADETVRVWDAQTGNLALGPLYTDQVDPVSIAFSSNGRRIAAGCSFGGVKIWDIETGKDVIAHINRPGCPNWSIVFSPDDKRIASCFVQNTVQVWDAETGVPLIGPLKGHSDYIQALTFCKDGTKIASGSRDRTVRVWYANSGQLIRPLKHDRSVQFVAFSSDGKTIISGSWGKGVYVWDVTTGALLAGPSYQHAEGTLAAVFTPASSCYCTTTVSPNGRWIASRSVSNTVQVWDSRTGQLAASIAVHTKFIYSVIFSLDSTRILTTSADQTVRIHTIHQ